LAASAGSAKLDRAESNSLSVERRLVGGVGASGDVSPGVEVPSEGTASLGGADSAGVDSGVSAGAGDVLFASSAEFASLFEPPHATTRAMVEIRTLKLLVMNLSQRAGATAHSERPAALLRYRIVPYIGAIGKNTQFFA
jgi:hypothetical protein